MRRLVPLVLTLGMTVVGAVLAAAQGLTGQISGTVTDSAGGVLAGVTVTVTNTATATTREAVTNAEGSFVLPDLLSGTYDIRITMSGFKSYELRGVALGATERLALRTVALEVGGIEETVNVRSEAVLVQTNTAARSGTISRDSIENLAVKGRDFTAYLRLLPGVIDTSSREAPGNGSLGGIQINGRTSFNFTMDGVTQKDTGANGGNYAAPALDSIAEIRVQTSNFQAEYGRSSGATINVVTRSGSKDFRGSAAFYKRHDSLNGNEYQRRLNCQNGLTDQCDAAPYNYDNSAWTLGGPVLIPGSGFNQNRNKLFFFFSQDLLPRKTPGATVTQRVPSALELQGNFSQTFDTQGRLVFIRDPLSGLPCNSVTGAGGGCFAGNIIPSNRIDQIGRTLLGLMPAANTTDPTGTNRYNFSVQARQDLLRTDQIGRVDWNVSPRATFYSRIQYGYERTTGDMPVQGWPIYPRKWEVLTSGVVNTFLYSFNPSTFMEVTAGVNWAHQDESPLNQEAQDRNDRSKVLPGFRQFFPDANPMNIIPNTTFNGGLPQNPATFSVGGRFPFDAYNRIWNYSGNVTKVAGPHNLKAGFFMEHTSRPAPNDTSFNGALSFNTDTENPCNTNIGLANALLGCVTSYGESTRQPYGHGVFNNVEWYVQDNWRVRRNVTLDYGVRFYHVGATRSDGDQVAQFVPTAWEGAGAPLVYVGVTTPQGRRARDPRTGQILPSAYIGRIVPGTGKEFNGMVVFDEQVMDSPPIKVGPRVGIAWDATGDGKTAVRAGAGVFYDRFPDHEFILLTANPPLTVTNSLNYTTVPELLTTPLTTTPANVSYWPQLDPPVTYNWSAGVQRDLGFGLVADAAYVGSASRDQLNAGGSGAPGYQIPLNGRPYGYRFRPENVDPTNVVGGVVQPYAEGQANHLRPMVGLGSVTQFLQIGEVNYHSMQVGLNRRRGSDGLSFGVSYTYQIANEGLRSLDPYIQDLPYDHPHTDNRARNWNAAGTRPHSLVINYTYDVPNLSRAWNNPVAKFFDDWQVSGITQVYSGTWGAITYAYDAGTIPAAVSAFVGTGGINTAGSRVHFTCDPNLPRSDRTFERQFRTDCVAPPTDPLLLGDSIGDEFHYQSLGFMNWDISLFKNIRLGGSRRLQLRAELYNAFNTDQWSGVDNSAVFNYQTGAQTDANFGRLTGATRDARRIQLAARFTF